MTSSLIYIGILGPKKRTQQLLTELQEDGHFFSESQLSRLYAPIGIDIGAEGSSQIALSIVAEIQAVLKNRTGGHLRNRLLPINDKDTSEAREIQTEDAKNCLLQTQCPISPS